MPSGNVRASLGLLLVIFTATGADAVQWMSSGSGFIVNSRGDVVTNAHVVVAEDGLCPVLSVENAGKASTAKVVAIDPGADLAVLRLLDPGQLIGAAPAPRAAPPPSPPSRQAAEKNNSDGDWVMFTGDPVSEDRPAVQKMSEPARSSRSYAHLNKTAPVRGQRAIVVGFPLSNVLSSEHKVTDGLVAATRGINDDPRWFQISVPVNPGNSGGPVFGDTGNIIGVTVAKIRDGEVTNFGVSLSTLKDLLQQNDIPFSEAASTEKMATEDLMAEAVQYTVFIRCGR